MDKVETQPWPWMLQPLETLEGGGAHDIPASQPRSPSIAPTEPDVEIPKIPDILDEVPKVSQEMPFKTPSIAVEKSDLQEVATPAKASLSTVDPTFQQTMTVPEIVAKVGDFTDQNANLPPALPGVNASNQRKGALSEVALTRREKRKQQMQEQDKVSKTSEAPKNWDNKNSISADEQCPPKRRGRKPKETKEASPKAKSASAKAKGRAKAKAKAKGNKGGKETKNKTSKPKASPKRKAPAASKEEETAPAAQVDKEQRKKQLSRKSAAYHKAFNAAKNNGETNEKCKELAKKVFSQHQSHLLVELFLNTKRLIYI